MNNSENECIVNCCAVAPDKSGKILDNNPENGRASIVIIAGDDNVVIPAKDSNQEQPSGYGLREANQVEVNRSRRPPRQCDGNRGNNKGAYVASGYNDQERD